MNIRQIKLSDNWLVAEEYDGNYIFENDKKSFCVNIDFVSNCTYPYSINFVQLKGDKIKIGIEDGAYSTHSEQLSDAFDKAIKMMLFIDSKT